MLGAGGDFWDSKGAVGACRRGLGDVSFANACGCVSFFFFGGGVREKNTGLRGRSFLLSKFFLFLRGGSQVKQDFDCDDSIRVLPFIPGLWRCLDESFLTKLNRDLTTTNPKVPAEHLDFLRMFWNAPLPCSSGK